MNIGETTIDLVFKKINVILLIVIPIKTNDKIQIFNTHTLSQTDLVYRFIFLLIYLDLFKQVLEKHVEYTKKKKISGNS